MEKSGDGVAKPQEGLPGDLIKLDPAKEHYDQFWLFWRLAGAHWPQVRWPLWRMTHSCHIRRWLMS